MESNSYYKELSEDNQRNFIARTLLFIWTTDFHSEPGFKVDQRMKFIISSAFVQITFGLKIDTLDTFNDIFIAPQSYKYKNNTSLFDGDVNLHTKRVNMAWPAIERGFNIPNDALNLCIHEFGHCLIFENASRSYFSRIFNDRDLKNWQHVATEKIQKLKSNKNQVLRAYGSTNLIELFSVSLESFFEKPLHFEHHEPVLYRSMVHLLNQDPRNVKNPTQ